MTQDTKKKELPVDLSRVPKLLRQIAEYALHHLCDNHADYLILKDAVSMLGYVLLYVVLLILIVKDPLRLKESLTYSDFSTSVLLVTTLLVALLIPIAISLMDGSDSKLDFVPPIIVRDVVKFHWLTLATFFICFYSLLPNNGRWKEALSPLVVVCWVIFFMSFVRTYLWLIDSTPANLRMAKPKPGGNSPGLEPGGGKSYKFSRVAKWLARTPDERPWQTIWGERRLPVDYEYQLHLMFIAKVDVLLDKKTKDAMARAGLILAVYVAGLPNRNLEDWRFYGIYLEKFLDIYVKIRHLTESRVSDGYLWQGEGASKHLFEQLFPTGFKLQDDYELFKAVQKYCEGRGLTKKLGKNDKVKEDPIVTMFLEAYFNAMFDDQFIVGNSYFQEYGKWAVTFDNLYVERTSLGFIVERTFSKWLRGRVKDKPNNLYRADSATSVVFPDVDTITVSQLYWFMFKFENTGDLGRALERYANEPPNFGWSGHASAMWDSSEDSKVHEQNYFKQVREQEAAAAKLFAHMYPQYFSTWTLKELRAAKQKLIKKQKIDDDHLPRLEAICQILEAIRELYGTDHN
jgi:hypothetical protein